MSRLDRQIEGHEEVSLELAELLSAFAASEIDVACRRQAMATFLSAGAGWRDAAEALGGTFAGLAPAATGLTGGKEP